MGGEERGAPASREPTLKYHPGHTLVLTANPVKPGVGQFQLGSLTGAVSSQRVTEEFKGTLSLFGNQALSVIVEGCLTARQISRAETKVGYSDPVVPNGRAIAHQTKGTPGITGLSLPSVHSGEAVWHLDVGSSHPGGGGAPKGLAVRQLKWYVSWVQTVVRQVGPYLLWAREICGGISLVRKDLEVRGSGVPVVMPIARLGS